MFAKSFTTVLVVTALVSGSPILRRQPGRLSAQNLLQIAPNTASCGGADSPSECATADVAAPNIAASFDQFGITSFGAQAALVATQLFESGDFKYARNHFPAPGVPGQGTRNMQSPTFNQKYAAWVADSCASCDVTEADVTQARAQGPAAVLALVNTDALGFASAAWFLKTQCDASIESGLAAGTQAAFSNYITQCVGATLTEDRISGWQNVQALGHW